MENKINKKASVTPVENKKGFKVISCPRRVLEAATGQAKCVCDNCLASPEVGYYVAILNRWLCPTCYEHWLASAERYEEDVWVEEKNYEYCMKILKQWNY